MSVPDVQLQMIPAVRLDLGEAHNRADVSLSIGRGYCSHAIVRMFKYMCTIYSHIPIACG